MSADSLLMRGDAEAAALADPRGPALAAPGRQLLDRERARQPCSRRTTEPAAPASSTGSWLLPSKVGLGTRRSQITRNAGQERPLCLGGNDTDALRKDTQASGPRGPGGSSTVQPLAHSKRLKFGDGCVNE